MSSFRVKQEKSSPERHRSKHRSRSRSRSQERVRIKKEKDDESHRNGHRSKDSRREHRGGDNRHRRDDNEQGGRQRGNERSRDRHQDQDTSDDKSRVRMRIKEEREQYDAQRRRDRKNRPQNPFLPNSQQDNGEWGRGPNQAGEDEEDTEAPPKDMPNFEVSGKLAEDTNTFRGVVIKYNEPPEARIPKRRWRFYVFKGEETLPVLHLHRQSAYLLGRDRKIADMPIDHPSCSKQHAVLQYRLVEFQRQDGTTGRRVRPYVIDLESSNGTFLNNKKIEAKRYYELQEKDVLKFGFSTREYVLLHANSKDSDDDDAN